MMFKKVLLFTLIIVLLCQDVQRTAIDDSLAMKVGESKRFSTRQDDNFKAFIFVNVKILQGKNLMFMINPMFASSSQIITVDIYQYVTQTNLTTCHNKPQQLLECALPQSNLKQNQSIMVIATCEGQCQFIFYTYWSNVQNLGVADKVQFMFGQTGKAQYYHISLQKMNFSEFRITLMPQTKQMSTQKVKIFGKYGFYDIEPTQQTYDFKSIDLWRDGQGIFLQKNKMKEDKITILVIGQSKTVYNLKTQVVYESHHDLDFNETLHDHLFPYEGKVYHIAFPQNVKDKQYLISFATFTGNLKFESYYDKQRSKPFESKPFTYLRDTKIVITPTQLQTMKDIYIQISSDQRQSVFMLDFDERNIKEGIQLDENINEFIGIKTKQIMYLHFEKWSTTQNVQLTINIMKIFGTLKVQFRICKSTINNCIDMSTYQNNTEQINNYDSTVIGLRNTFKFNITDEQTKYINPVEKAGYVIIVITNTDPKPSEQCIAIVQYMHNSQVQLLREGKPIQQIIKFGQTKIYKYLPTDENITAVKIYLNQIHGTHKIQGFREDPRNNQNAKQISESNPLVFIQDLDKPIFIRVTGLSQGVFGIIPQPIFKDNLAFSSISLTQQVQFSMILQPDQYQVFTVHPLYSSINLKYRSTGPISTCVLKKKQLGCIDIPNFGALGQVHINDTQSVQQLIQIHNIAERAVQINLFYHSSNYSHCEVYKMDKLYHESFKNGQCLGFSLDSNADDVLIYFQRKDLGSMTQKMYVCQKEVNVSFTHYFTLKKEAIKENCEGRNPTDWTLGFILKAKSSTEEHIKVQFIVQYESHMAILTDGTSYPITGVSGQSQMKTFVYDLINNQQTHVYLTNIIGRQTFYAKLVENKNKGETKVTKNDYHFLPNSPNYYKDGYLIIKQKDIQQKCKNCSLIITVYSTQKSGVIVKSTIQVVQNSQLLNDHELIRGQVNKDSIAYYQYLVKQDNVVIIDLSDNNILCSKMFLSMKDLPNQQNALAKNQVGKIVMKLRKGIYYIGVQGIQDCAYSISVFSTNYHLVRLERGLPSNIKIKKGQIQYFLMHQYKAQSFKLSAFAKYGTINMYINESTTQIIDELQQKQKIEFEKFQIHHQSRFTAFITNQTKGYCSNCEYMIVIEAVQDTDASLILSDQDSEVELNTIKTFHDEIKGLNMLTHASLRGVYKGVISALVYQGSIQITVQSDKFKQTSQLLKKQGVQQNFTFDVNKTIGSASYWQPIHISIKCLDKVCIYSLNIANLQKQNTFTSDKLLTPGRPLFLFLNTIQQSNEIYVHGYIKDNKQKFLFSIGQRSKQILKKLEFDFKTSQNGTYKNTKFDKVQVNNVISLTTNIEEGFTFKQPLEFKIRVSITNEGLSDQQKFGYPLMVQQLSNVNLMLQQTDVVVTNQQDYLIYPEGQFIVDVFQCAGHTSLQKKQNFEQSNQLTQNTMTFLDKLGMPDQPHAVKMQSFTPTVIRVNSLLSVIRWMPLNLKEGRGLGYIKYTTGSLNYDSVYDTINLKLDSLRLRDNETKNSDVDNIIYTIYISGNQNHLKSAVQCQRFLPSDVLQLFAPITKETMLNSSILYEIKKNIITEKFKQTQNIFINVVADMTINVKQQNDEITKQYYRFIYHYQQIPREVLSIVEKEQFNLILKIVLVVVSALSALLVIYCIIAKLVPLLSRLRNRMMVEESNENKQDPGEVIPPSSDRARITTRKVGEDLAVEPAQE